MKNLNKNKINVNEKKLLNKYFHETVNMIAKKKLIKNNINPKNYENALYEIFNFYNTLKTKSINIPLNKNNLNFLLNSNNLLSRKIILTKNWHKETIGAIYAYNIKKNKIVALTPTKTTGYEYKDHKTGKRIKITKKNEKDFDKKALMFYKALPNTTLSIKDVLKYIFSYIPTTDYFLIFLTSFLITIIGLFIPKINKIVLYTIVKLFSIKLLTFASIFIFCIMFSRHILNIFKNILSIKITKKLNIKIKNSIFIRILNMPITFFNKNKPSEIFMTLEILEEFYETLIQNFLQTLLTSFFCIFYVMQIFSFTPSLVLPAIGTIFLISIFTIAAALIQKNLGYRKIQATLKETSSNFLILKNIAKINLTASEERIFPIWAKNFAKKTAIEYNPHLFIKINKLIFNLIILLGSIFIYYTAAKEKISPTDFFSFATSYAILIAGFKNFYSTAINIAKSKCVLKLINPILKTAPEQIENKIVLYEIKGNIKIQNLSFSYNNSQKILTNLNVKIQSGDSVAVVGKSGKGKSTLLKLLIGFETPTKGEIYIDEYNIKTIALKHLRQLVGVVMQNSRLIYGSILENIALVDLDKSYDDIIKIIKIVDLYDDIKNMPLKLDTLISQDAKEISTSQKQKILLARAILKKPNLFLLDEATCFLDKSTKIKIFNFLNNLNSTKVFFTHDDEIIKRCNKKIYL